MNDSFIQSNCWLKLVQLLVTTWSHFLGWTDEPFFTVCLWKNIVNIGKMLIVTGSHSFKIRLIFIQLNLLPVYPWLEMPTWLPKQSWPILKDIKHVLTDWLLLGWEGSSVFVFFFFVFFFLILYITYFIVWGSYFALQKTLNHF